MRPPDLGSFCQKLFSREFQMPCIEPINDISLIGKLEHLLMAKIDDDLNDAPQSTYSIPSVRQVVHALVVQNRDLAEEAAIRACYDCDLLLRLVQDLVGSLQPLVRGESRQDLSEAATLIARAKRMLQFIEGNRGINPTEPNRSDTSNEVRGFEAQVAGRNDLRSSERKPIRPAIPTVASLGLRVHLVVDHERANAPAGDREERPSKGEKDFGPSDRKGRSL
jgi:hypothetical protein